MLIASTLAAILLISVNPYYKMATKNSVAAVQKVAAFTRQLCFMDMYSCIAHF